MPKDQRSLQTRKTLLPGKPGTMKLVEQYGDDLVCVRYRYDAEQHLKFKTIEVIIEQSPWDDHPRRIPHNKTMYLRVKYGEVEIGRMIRDAGGKWNRHKRVWELAYKHVVALNLTDRIVHLDTNNRPDG